MDTTLAGVFIVQYAILFIATIDFLESISHRADLILKY